MKQYQLFYRVEPQDKHPQMIQLPAEDMWEFIEKVKEIYPNYKDQFTVENIVYLPPTGPVNY
jgi:hypothetical protein